MKSLPRSFEYRKGDTAENVGTRLAIWTRDVIAAFKRIPDVTYIEVPVASGGSVDVESAGTPAAVSVARVVSGTVTATPGIEWTPINGGFRVEAVYGITGSSRLMLRVEV